MIKVCFISHYSGVGGAEKALLELIDGLVERGVVCNVIIPDSGPIAKELEKREIEYAVIPFKRWASISKTISLWKRLVRNPFNLLVALLIALRARKWQSDIIYTNTCTIGVGALASLILSKPHIWHIHEFGYEDHSLTFDLSFPISVRLMARLSRFVITNSYAVTNKYRRYISKDKLRMVYCAMRTFYKPGDEDCSHIKLNSVEIQPITKLIITGAIKEGKGQIDAVRALGELTKQSVSVELIIVGAESHEYLKKLRQVISDNKINDLVKFTGYVNNPVPIVATSDIVLVCSRAEGFGRVTVEGMRLKKPIIGAGSGATPELVKEGFNGLLYEPGNYHELACKIKYLIDHPNITKQMGENGFQWAKTEFTMEKYAGGILRILQEALPKPHI